MIWKKPHISKIYEALTAIADDMLEINGNKAKCYLSSGDKFYDIQYDPINSSIMSNDNTAFYTYSLSYPMIAYLMLINKIPYERKLLEILKDICWENINKKFKNDYDKSIKLVLGELKSEGENVDFIREEIQKIYNFVCKLEIKTLGKLQKPLREY
ncbi:MAG: hypothetical protein PHE32_01845 [Candidatus Shapirobacteria bacterium]|nr:hypothetical protein [Candidatus Shapirobacteria bacterium]MDD4410417.1 hypothetical protein [Candidatus Shapirobacteria bacterium]